MRIFALAVLLASVGAAEDIEGFRIRAHTKFLAHDLLEGRGVGTRGGDLAVEYLAAQFALLGARPAGDDGTYFQKVPLVGVATAPSAALAYTPAGKPEVKLRWLDDFVGVTQRQTEGETVDAEAIFVGHGIVAPEYRWDDFQGVDVRGKVLVLFTNEPPSEDPKFFGGRALTYYGRWTYKYEQAARVGAAAVLIVHTTPTAGYGYDVVKSSWGREDMQVKLAAGAAVPAFTGWVSQEAGERLFAGLGKTVAEMLAMADKPGFRPVPLKVRFRANIPSKIRQVESRNVAAMIPGSDPRKAEEAVVFSAHWDHLGVGAAVNGDAIYNGAVDNATGCAMLIEMARAWQALPIKPRRSALFLSVTAEENGLRGAEYYARNPRVPAGKTAANLNFDAFYPFGRTRDVVVSGAERTTLWPVVQDVAARFQLAIKPDPRPEQGSYFRSDHFPFAKAGVPAFSVHLGSDFLGKPAGFGDTIFREYNAKHYHQPTDEYKDDWDFAGMEQAAKFGFTLGLEIANMEGMPGWNAGDAFQAAREASGAR